MARWLGLSDQIADGFPTHRRSRRRESALTLTLLLAVGLALVLLSPGADAKQKFLSGFAQAYPAAAGSSLDSCLLCHTDPVHPGEDNLNGYGSDWEDGDFGDKDFLAPALVKRDSDGDGVLNGQEIQQLSLPGDPSSNTPPTTTTTVPGTSPDGRALYEARCAACHGANGGNLTGTSLPRTTFIDVTLNGRGGMPAQNGISSAEVGAIWDFVTGSLPATTTTTQPGATTTTTAAAGGATVWAQKCAICHGANGGNVVPTGLTRTQLVSVVSNGTVGMPPFASLGSTQVGNVVDYLLGLTAPTTTLPGATTTTTRPRSGATVFAASCALCHGSDGGDLRGNSLSLSQVIDVVARGQGSMSGFAGRLSTAEIDNVGRFVRSVGTSAGVTATTAAPGSVVSGSTLYMQNCSSCHGLHGEGGSGGAVAGTSMNRAQVISVITSGTSGMPDFKTRLSAAEIAAIADHVLAGGGTGAPDVSSTAIADRVLVPPELVEGQTLFGQFCAACHGANGEGGLGGPVAGIGMTAVDLDEIIRNGVGSMPGFAERMRGGEVAALVAFTEALASGREFSAEEVTTTTNERVDGKSGPQALDRPLSAESGSNSPLPVVVVSLLAGLIAAGAAVLWARLGRDLTR